MLLLSLLSGDHGLLLYARQALLKRRRNQIESLERLYQVHLEISINRPDEKNGSLMICVSTATREPAGEILFKALVHIFNSLTFHLFFLGRGAKEVQLLIVVWGTNLPTQPSPRRYIIRSTCVTPMVLAWYYTDDRIASISPRPNNSRYSSSRLSNSTGSAFSIHRCWDVDPVVSSYLPCCSMIVRTAEGEGKNRTKSVCPRPASLPASVCF